MNWDNREEVLAVVKINPNTLENASDRLKADKGIVLIAVTKDGRALRYASDKLKDDKEVVLVAVTQHKDALKYASERLGGEKQRKNYKLELWGVGVEFAYGPNPDNVQVISELLSGDYNAVISIDLSGRDQWIIVSDQNGDTIKEIDVKQLSVVNAGVFNGSDDRFTLRNHWIGGESNLYKIIMHGRGTFGEVVVDEVPNENNIFLLGNYSRGEISVKLPDPIVVGVVICDSPEQKDFFVNMVEYHFDIEALKEDGVISAGDMIAFGYSNLDEIINDIVEKSKIWNTSNYSIETQSMELL